MKVRRLPETLLLPTIAALLVASCASLPRPHWKACDERALEAGYAAADLYTGGPSNDVSGPGNRVYGKGNKVTGEDNCVIGEGNVVRGNRNNVTGSRNTIGG
ncbi:MAG: hypothetical protein ACR2RA_08260 [Geminicoccaceae bacterium]